MGNRFIRFGVERFYQRAHTPIGEPCAHKSLRICHTEKSRFDAHAPTYQMIAELHDSLFALIGAHEVG